MYENVTTSPTSFFTNVWNILRAALPYSITQNTGPFNRSDFEFDPMVVNAFYECVIFSLLLRLKTHYLQSQHKYNQFPSWNVGRAYVQWILAKIVPVSDIIMNSDVLL